MNSFLWFILGFAFCRIMQNLYIIGKISIFMRKAAEDALKLLGTAAEDIAYIRQLKHQTVEKYGDSEQLKRIKNTDDHVFNSWKRSAVENFKRNFPEPYNKAIEFKNWDEAMEVLDKIHKSELERTNVTK